MKIPTTINRNLKYYLVQQHIKIVIFLIKYTIENDT